jgi:hypothetical protein
MRIPCLSIQQPWAAMILNGDKLVENRSRRWNPNWTDGSILLGIHASKSQQEWSKRTDEEKDRFVPDWRCSDSLQFGSVLGVVDLVRICRPNELPPGLRKHRYVSHEPENWCWVLENPRRLLKPFRARGQAALFYVEIPHPLLRSGYLTVTQGNLDNGSLCVTDLRNLFPEDVFGKSAQPARRTVRVIWGDEVVETDIVRSKNIFRRRTWGRFFDAQRIQVGNRILLEQLEPYLYRISKE